jgi:thiol-disulfide isomerase/thioredoxin
VAYQLGRPTVVNFFAAWCDPCKKELPNLTALARTSPSVTFIGVDVADSRSNATDLLASAGVVYSAGYDPDRAVARRYHVAGIPTTVFVRADGRIDGIVRGPIGPAALRQRVRHLAGSA